MSNNPENGNDVEGYLDIVSREERKKIRNQVWWRYPGVTVALRKGQNPEKARGAWAKPIILRLLKTCDDLERDNERLRNEILNKEHNG